MFLFALIFLSSISTIQLSNTDTLTVESEIRDVTIFQRNAQITRTATVDLSEGLNTLNLEGISPSLDPQSINIKGSGSFVVQSMSTSFYEVSPNMNNELLEKFQAQVDSLKREIKMINSEISVLQSKKEFTNSLQTAIGNTKYTSTEIKDLINLYGNELLNIEKEIFILNESLLSNTESIQNLQKKLSFIKDVEISRELTLEIQSPSSQIIDLVISYQIYNASWKPKYIIRSSESGDDISFSLQASLNQYSKIDWNKVNLTINSGDPSQAIDLPSLMPEDARFFQSVNTRGKSTSTIQRVSNRGVISGLVIDQDGQPVPATNVSIKNMAMGAVTDLKGFFTIKNIPPGKHVLEARFVGYKEFSRNVDMSQGGLFVTIIFADDLLGLDEVVVSGYGVDTKGEFDVMVRGDGGPDLISTSEASNQTSFSYSLDKPYSLPDGVRTDLEISRDTLAANYGYFTIPKISPYTYKRAELTGWDKLDLLKGEVSVYSEDTYIGRFLLDPSQTADTLKVSLGIDERIRVKRKQLREFEERRLFRSRVRQTNVFEISIRNTRSVSILVEIQDQIPLSSDESISINTKELSGGSLNEETGIITWKLNLDPGESRSLKFSFEVEYPKGEKVLY